MDTQDPSPRELWLRAFNHVRDTIDVATIWLAMQAAAPITIDGHYFVVGLAPDDSYLLSNLQGYEAVSAIQDSLQQQTGRILALQVIIGTTLQDWQAQKTDATGLPSAPAAPAQPSTSPPPADALPPPDAPFPDIAASPAAFFSVPGTLPPDPSPTWDKLNERLAITYKAAPIKYPQGQGRFVLQAARLISDTIDTLLPAPGLPPDEAGERALARSLERLGSIINLDPLFLAMEVMRYRQSHGKEIF